MMTHARKRVKKEKGFLPDMMPVEIRESIARAVTRNGKCTDEALNLALTSELQRRAVLATIPKHQFYHIPMGETESLSHEWAKLLAGHVNSVHIFPVATTNRPERDNQNALGRFLRASINSHWSVSPNTQANNLGLPAAEGSPLNQLLRAPQLETATIPGNYEFLLSVRHATSLHHLCVSVEGCLIDTLIQTLRCIGTQLTKLSLDCSEKRGRNVESPSTAYTQSHNCPMKMCAENGPSTLPVLCPNLRNLRLDCGHIQPGTISTLVGGLPFLESVGMDDYHRRQKIDLSEEDILSLKRLDDVELHNISGGLRRVSQVGRSLTSVVQVVKEDPGAVLELAKCPRLRSCHLRISLQDLKKFADVVVPFLTDLKVVTVMLNFCFCFAYIEEAAVEAVKILRIRDDPAAKVVLRCATRVQRSIEEKDVLVKVATIIENEGGSMVLTLHGSYLLELKISWEQGGPA